MAKDVGRHARRVLGKICPPIPPPPGVPDFPWRVPESGFQYRLTKSRRDWKREYLMKRRLGWRRTATGWEYAGRPPEQYGPSPIPRSRKSGRPLT